MITGKYLTARCSGLVVTNSVTPLMRSVGHFVAGFADAEVVAQHVRLADKTPSARGRCAKNAVEKSFPRGVAGQRCAVTRTCAPVVGARLV